MRRFPAIAGLCLASNVAYAGPLLDYIRNYDLNDYALGIAVSAKQNPFVGAENGLFAYPYLTSFRDSALTNDWLLVRDGDIGVRWLSRNGEWEVGFAGRIQTLGLNDSDAEEVSGIADREWTLEAGPLAGWRGWPIHVGVRVYGEVSDRHDGMTGQVLGNQARVFQRLPGPL